MDQHQMLIDTFKSILGNENVYFQPPESARIQYPCIIFNLNGMKTFRADNNLYGVKKGYIVTYIDPDPGSTAPVEILSLPLCSFDRFFFSDNLNHYVFELYY